MEKKSNGLTVKAAQKPTIHFHLDQLQIKLSSNSTNLLQFARQFLANWTISDELAQTPTCHISLDLVSGLPPLPELRPIFAAKGGKLPDEVGALFVYQQPDGLLLYFQDGGLVHIEPAQKSSPRIKGYVTTRLLQYGRLHDLLLTSLSPFLRQHGYYLLHASAVVHQNEAIIFVGAQGCGKSTTVLNLAFNGWRVLSDDALMLQQRPDGIYALPTPGGFSIRPKSLSHLPTLAKHVPPILPGEFYHLALNKMGLNYAGPTLIKTIYFPHIDDENENEKRPLSSAIALAHLIEFSLDRWDSAALPAHIAFLEQLSHQAPAYSLIIANQQEMPELLT